jgi:hypothetical protein
VFVHHAHAGGCVAAAPVGAQHLHHLAVQRDGSGRGALGRRGRHGGGLQRREAACVSARRADSGTAGAWREDLACGARTAVCACAQTCASRVEGSEKKARQERQPRAANSGPQLRLALKPARRGRGAPAGQRARHAAGPRAGGAGQRRAAGPLKQRPDACCRSCHRARAPYRCSVSASKVEKCLWQRSQAASWELWPAAARCSASGVPFSARRHSGHAGPASAPTHGAAPSGDASGAAARGAEGDIFEELYRQNATAAAALAPLCVTPARAGAAHAASRRAEAHRAALRGVAGRTMLTSACLC